MTEMTGSSALLAQTQDTRHQNQEHINTCKTCQKPELAAMSGGKHAWETPCQGRNRGNPQSPKPRIPHPSPCVYDEQDSISSLVSAQDPQKPPRQKREHNTRRTFDSREKKAMALKRLHRTVCEKHKRMKMRVASLSHMLARCTY